MARLKIRWVKSAIGRHSNQQQTVRSLGLRRLRQEVVHEDNATIRGMVATVSHLVEVEEVD